MESIIKSNTLKACVMILGILWSLIIIALYYCRCHVRLSSLDNGSSDSPILNIFGKEARKDSLKNGSSADIKLVCYYVIPHNGSTEAPLTTEDVDPTLCTHIIVSKAIIENTTIVPVDAGDLKVYAEVVALKKQNPSLNVILSLASGFSSLVQDRMAVAVFAYNAHKFLITHGFDGLDLDWEFPAWPPGKKTPKEKTWFTYLLLQLNSALKLASHPPLLLTVAVGASQNVIDNSYEIDQLAKCVDFVSVMGYNYHMFKPYLPFTGHNSPLSKSSNKEGYFATLNIQWDTIYWMKKGIPKEKLVIGIPTFGRTWKLLESEWYHVGAPAVAEGMLQGKITYPEACIFVKEGATRYFDNASKVPYAVRDRDWVSYEDIVSIKNKVLCEIQRITEEGKYVPSDPRELCGRLLFTLHMPSPPRVTHNTNQLPMLPSAAHLADQLAKEIGSKHLSVAVEGGVSAMVESFTAASGFCPRHQHQGGSALEEEAFNHLHSRLRMTMAYLFSQMGLWSHGRAGELVVLASISADNILASSWAKYGDTSADVNLLARFPKKEIEKALLIWAKDKLNLPTLKDIVASRAREREGRTPTEEEMAVMGNLQAMEYCGPYSMFSRLIYLWRNKCSTKEMGEKTKAFFQWSSLQRHKMTALATPYYVPGTGPPDVDRPLFYSHTWSWQFTAIDRAVEQYDKKEKSADILVIT